jgi:hypothetical protein
MTFRLLFLLAGLASPLTAQGPFNRELLGFPPRDSSTACKLKRTDDLPPGATQAYWFWVGLAVPTVRTGAPNAQVLATMPPPRQIWVAYDRSGIPVVLADTVHDQMGHSVAQVQFGPGLETSGFTWRADIDTALVRKLMNNTGGRTVTEAVDSISRALLRGPRTMLDAETLHRARKIGEFLWTRRCLTGVPG